MTTHAAAAAVTGNPLAFYQVAATVIPVLFLAFLYQQKGLEHPLGWHENQFGWTAIFVGVAAAGEIAAFRVLGTQHPTDTAKVAVASALIFTGLSVAFEVVSDALVRAAAQRDVSRRKRLAIIVTGVGAIVVLIGEAAGWL